MISEPPAKPWWIDLSSVCKICGHKVTLEIHDKVIGFIHKHNGNELVAIECPTCEYLIEYLKF